MEKNKEEKIMEINKGKELEWSDQLGSRRRSPWLLFIKGDDIIPFKGQSIKGVVVVKGTDYTKQGDWSHTDYRLKIAGNGIRVITGKNGWETGRFTEGLGSAVGCKTPDTWAETAKALGVSVPSAMKFVKSHYPSDGQKLDKVEQELMALEEEPGQKELAIIVVSFGAPTNKDVRDGYWQSPRGIPGYDGAIRLINPNNGWVKENIEVVGISGTILDVKWASGRNGGYYAVSVAIRP